MSAFLLILKNSNTNALQSVLGVYSTWQNAWTAFHKRWKRGGHPFTGGRLPYADAEGFYYAIAQINPKAVSIRIYQNDFVTVDIVKTTMDAPL